MRETKRNNNGTTLIALIVTIIVLLILAGVTIATLIGDNGILTKANEAERKTEEAEEEEKINLAIIASSIEGNKTLNAKSLKNELESQFRGQELYIIDNGDGSFLISIDERKYYINDDTTVISNENIVEIKDSEDLKNFRDDVNSGNSYEGKVVLLTNDIDLNGEEWEPIRIL